MTPNPKSFSLRPLADVAEAIFTATSPTIVGSVIGATTNGTARTADVGIRRVGSADVDWLSKSIPVAFGGSANLIPAKVSLSVGEALVAVSKEQEIGQLVSSADCWPEAVKLLLAKPDGSQIIGVCGASGIWLSEDGMVTARQVRAGTHNQTIGAYFNGKFRIYTSATAAVVSADGVTWAAETVTGAPIDALVSPYGNVIKVGADLYSFRVSTKAIIKTSDGVTWAEHGVASAITGTFGGLLWTGQKWVVLAGIKSSYYFAKHAPEDASAWTSSTGISNVHTAELNAGGLAFSGGVLYALIWNSVGGAMFVAISDDHGVSFNSPTIPVGIPSGSNASIHSFGSAVLVSSGSHDALMPTAESVRYSGPTSFSGATAPAFAYTDTEMLSYRCKAPKTFTRRAGLTVTASVLELGGV